MFQEHKKSNKSKKVTFSDEKVTADIVKAAIERVKIISGRLWLDDKAVCKMESEKRRSMEATLEYYQKIIESFGGEDDYNPSRPTTR